MNLLFLNKTRYSSKLYELFLKFHADNFGAKYLIYHVIGLIAIIFLLILQLYYSNFIFVGLLAFFSIAYFFFKFIKPVQKVSNDFKSTKISKKESLTYEFYDEFFLITKKNKEYKKYYSNIYKVFEVKHFYYVYASKRTCYIVDKQGFINSDLKKFSKFIKNKCIYIKKDS